MITDALDYPPDPIGGPYSRYSTVTSETGVRSQNIALGESVRPMWDASTWKPLLDDSGRPFAKSSNIPIIATAVSGSGKTIAVVRERDFFIYQTEKVEDGAFTGGPTYIGRFDSFGNWSSGFQGPQLKPHGPFLQCAVRSRRFGSATLSDELLVTGGYELGWVGVFSVNGVDPRPGHVVYHWEPTDERDPQACKGWEVKRVLFNHQGTEFVVVFGVARIHKEIWRFYTASPNFSHRLGRLASLDRAPTLPSPTARWIITRLNEVPVKVSLNELNQELYFKTRDAKFSADDMYLVTCTTHYYGISLVTLMAKDGQGIWQLKGTRKVQLQMRPGDESCLGLTGVDL